MLLPSSVCALALVGDDRSRSSRSLEMYSKRGASCPVSSKVLLFNDIIDIYTHVHMHIQLHIDKVACIRDNGAVEVGRQIARELIPGRACVAF